MVNLTRKKEGKKEKLPEITRLMDVLKSLSLKPVDIARDNDISERTITNFIWENKPIGGQLLRILHVKYGVSIDWLLSGTGEMFVAAGGINEQKPEYTVINPRAWRMQSFITEFMASASDDEKVWLEMQFKFSVPQYAQFLERVGK